MNESGSWSYSLLELIFVMSLFSLTELWQECDSTDFSLSAVLIIFWAQHINWYTGQGILNILTDICLIKITTSVLQVWASFSHLSSVGLFFLLKEKKKGWGKCYLCIKHFELPRWKPAYISIMHVYCLFSDEKWQPSAWNGIRNSDSNREERSTNE